MICIQVFTVLGQMSPALKSQILGTFLRGPGQEGLQATVRKKEGEKARVSVASSFFVSGDMGGLTLSFIFSFYIA